GLPDITISYGAVIEPTGSDRDREKFTYLGELYACKRETFESATAGAKVTASKAEAKAAAAAPAPAPVPAADGPRLDGERLGRSEHQVWRAAVPGGWLVTLGVNGVTFVPDAKHQWDGGSVD